MQHEPVIVFDGVCCLCEASVNFVIRRDAQGTFKFAAAQSKAGQALQTQYGFDALLEETVVLVKDQRVFLRSDAAVEIAKELDGAWKALYLIKFVPRPLRDSVYKSIAKRRYQWFGAKAQCMLPSEDVLGRFL